MSRYSQFVVLFAVVAVTTSGCFHARKCNRFACGDTCGFGVCGVRMCDNCDEAPAVIDGHGGGGCGCGSCGITVSNSMCGGCGPCGGGGGCGCGPCGNHGVCGVFHWLFGWIGHCGECNGCGEKYIPEWRERPCEPCDRCANWTGPSIHKGKPYYGMPRSGSNLGTPVEAIPGSISPAPAPTEAAPLGSGTEDTVPGKKIIYRRRIVQPTRVIRKVPDATQQAAPSATQFGEIVID